MAPFMQVRQCALLYGQQIPFYRSRICLTSKGAMSKMSETVQGSCLGMNLSYQITDPIYLSPNRIGRPQLATQPLATF